MCSPSVGTIPVCAGGGGEAGAVPPRVRTVHVGGGVVSRGTGLCSPQCGECPGVGPGGRGLEGGVCSSKVVLTEQKAIEDLTNMIMSRCLPACLLLCLSVYVFLALSLSLVYTFACVLHLSTSPSMSTHHIICMSVYLPFCVSVCVYVWTYLYIYLSSQTGLVCWTV